MFPPWKRRDSANENKPIKVELQPLGVRSTPAAAVRAVVPSARADLLTFVALPRARIQLRDRGVGGLARRSFSGGGFKSSRPDQSIAKKGPCKWAFLLYK